MYAINQRRDQAGLPPLKRNATLDSVAAGHSTRMGEQGFVAHCDPIQKTWPDQRAASAGFSSAAMGESLAAGPLDPTSLATALLASPGHQAVLLSPQFREIGAGRFYDEEDQATVWRDLNHDCTADTFTNGPYYDYWTITPALRYGSYYPVVINLEQPSTDVLEVELYLYGEGWADEMRIRNQDGTWTAWMPFASEVQWQLSTAAVDEYEVFVEIRTGGLVYSASDTINRSGAIFTDGFETGDLLGWDEVGS